MQIKKVSEILIASADAALLLQSKDGSFPSGHNGPYFDTETPVRNTAHYLFLLSELYSRIGDERYKIAAEKAANYFFSIQARPGKKTFFIRNKQGKDKCNGLIGQAWVIEALIKASIAFDRNDYYELADEIFSLHPWDDRLNIWKRVDIDGNILSYDVTFNHQLWFAAAGSMLHKSDLAQCRVEKFVENVLTNMKLYKDGVIFHSSPMATYWNYLRSGRKIFVLELKRRLLNRIRFKRLYLKSVGYHAFNLYALAILAKSFPSSVIWSNGKLKKVLEVRNNVKFLDALNHSEFAFKYNVSGLEMAFAIETLIKNDEEVKAWINRQFTTTYTDDANALTNGAADKNTARSRIYEMTRLIKDYEAQIT